MSFNKISIKIRVRLRILEIFKKKSAKHLNHKKVSKSTNFKFFSSEIE
jgi:hypothetical protein